MLSMDPAIPLLMASFNPLIASIMTPALLYASTTRMAQILTNWNVPKRPALHIHITNLVVMQKG